MRARPSASLNPDTHRRASAPTHQGGRHQIPQYGAWPRGQASHAIALAKASSGLFTPSMTQAERLKWSRSGTAVKSIAVPSQGRNQPWILD